MTPPADDDFSSRPRDAGVGQPPRDLHPTSDIRFVIVEIAKLTERVDNLAKAIVQEDDRDEKRADKIDKSLEKIDVKIDAKAKELNDELKELKASATFVKGWLAGLTFAGLIVGYFFHDQLQHIAEAVAKFGK